MIKNKLIFGLCGMFIAPCVYGAMLSGSASLNITSDTAANAKKIAMNEARRQIIMDAIGPYVNSENLRTVLYNTDSAELTNLVSSVSIDNEKLSDTTYNATISMVIDSEVMRTWLTGKEIQNWLPSEHNTDVFSVVATLSNPIVNWAELNAIARAQNIDVVTDSIVGKQITFYIPMPRRSSFTAAVRGYGWQYSGLGESLKISK